MLALCVDGDSLGTAAGIGAAVATDPNAAKGSSFATGALGCIAEVDAGCAELFSGGCCCLNEPVGREGKP